MIEVLCCASERMYPFLVLGAFAGIRHAEIQRLDWRDIHFDDGIIEIRASKAKTASRRLVPIVDNLREWLIEHRQPSGEVAWHRNVAFEMHMIAKRANKARRRAWAVANRISAEQLEANEEQAKKAAERQEKKGHRQQRGEVPPGAETAGVEGWEQFGWKHNALRHSFISYRVAKIKNVNEVAMEAGNSPDMIFKHYRELVTEKEADAWFGVTPDAVKAAKAAAEKERAAKVVKLGKEMAAA